MKRRPDAGVPREQVGSLGRAVRSNAVLKRDQVTLLKQAVLGALGPALREAVAARGPLVDDVIRLKPLATRCRERREELGRSLAQVARLCGVPQYRLKAIEASRTSEILPETLDRYVEYLSIVQYYHRWRRENAELMSRLGRPRVATDGPR